MMMTIVYSFVFYDVPWPAKKYNVSGGRQGEWKRWGGTAERERGRESKPQWMKLVRERKSRCSLMAGLPDVQISFLSDGDRKVY